MNVSYSASLAAVPSGLCTAVKDILAVGEDIPTDPMYVYQWVVMVHFDPSANIDGEMASLRLPDSSLYLVSLPPVSRLHLLTTSVNMSSV
jgi:hypothetical protein